MKRRRQSGQAILLFIVLIGVAGGLLGLAVDGARIFEEKQRVQSMADAAAIGAALELKSTGNEAALTEAALMDVRINGFRDESDELTLTKIEAGPDQDGVRVSVQRRVRTTLMAMFGAPELFVNALASATLARGAAPCVLALADDGPGALVIEGDGAVRIGCQVEVRSVDPDALMLSGDGCISADGVSANTADTACVSPEPKAVLQRVASTQPGPAPTCAGRPAGASTESAEGVVDYWPGCYAERIVIGDGKTRFSPGEYVLLDGLEILGGETTAADVTFAVAGGSVEILDDATVELDSGVRPNLFDSAATEGAAQITPGPASVISGGLYFPARNLIWRPNSYQASSWNTATANSIRLIVEDDERAIAGPPGGSQLSAARPVLIR